MHKYLLFTLLVLVGVSCVHTNKSIKLGIIVYTAFDDPKASYNSLTKSFLNSGLVDSLTVIGLPIQEHSIDIQFDSAAVYRYGLSFEDIENIIEPFVSTSAIDELLLLDVTNHEGQNIPLSAFSKVSISAGYYKPEVFIPTPNVFYFEGVRTVKVELFSKAKHETELIRLIKELISSNATRFKEEQWKFEIVRCQKQTNENSVRSDF